MSIEYLNLLYQDAGPTAPAPSTLKDNTKFHFLLGQVFCSKQKDQILPATIEKKQQILSLKEIRLIFLCTLKFIKISNYTF